MSQELKHPSEHLSFESTFQGNVYRTDIRMERGMITGYDAVFAVAIEPGPRMAAFLDKLVKRWPDLIVQSKSDGISTEFH